LKHFNQLGLAETILRAVTAEGYTTPTPIQAKVIPAMLEGRDIVGIAQTGTGKTAAFVLPLLQQLRDTAARADGKSCRALILAPTRELAAQIVGSIRAYGKFMHISSTLIVGGAKPGPQIKTLARGVDIIVATPGRLEDHVSTGALRLDRTTTIVLDEADQMMDLGFMPSIRRIMARLPKSRQTVLLSATMPKQIRSLANDFLKNPFEIAVAPQARPIELIDQQVVFVDQPAKRRVLTAILSGVEVRRTIVFTRTKRGAEGVMKYLAGAGFDVLALHGNKSQRQRDQAMAAFRSGRVNTLVATDVAARGIDVDDISHIINFELPNVPESYVHRIGRTARAGKGGVAISLCDGSERKHLREIERLTGSPIRKENLTGIEPAPTDKANAWTPKAGVPEGEDKKDHGHTGKPFKHWGKKKAGKTKGWTGGKSKFRGKRKAA